ncbi:MAG: NDP-sugar synthase, partial [Actinomycetota bacterium]
RPFGLVPTEADGRVIEFREKPAELAPGDINAGTYVLEPSALASWETGRNVSIEREIFPALIAEGRSIHGFVTDAYWIDLGTPERYLQAHFDLLDGRVHGEPEYPAPFIAVGAVVAPDGAGGRRVVVGPRASVDGGAVVEDSVLHPGATVGPRAVVRSSILGPDSAVGGEVTECVVGEGASVPEGSVLAGERIPAGQTPTPG